MNTVPGKQFESAWVLPHQEINPIICKRDGHRNKKKHQNNGVIEFAPLQRDQGAVCLIWYML